MDKQELKHRPEWIKDHLIVLEVGLVFDLLNNSGLVLINHLSMSRSIEVVRTLTIDSLVKKDTRASTAHAKSTLNGITLCVASGLELDWFDVASGLCSLLLINRKNSTNDAMLFMNVLSTSLRNLQRRGVNIDRILAKRRVEAAEQKEAERLAATRMVEVNSISPLILQVRLTHPVAAF